MSDTYMNCFGNFGCQTLVLFPNLAAFCVSMYQVGGVVGTILIGYLSDKFLKQVNIIQFIILLKFLQDRGKNFEHARAPALFLVSILLTIVLRLLNSAVKPRVSEVSNKYGMQAKFLYF